jgi:hypothetical protein
MKVHIKHHATLPVQFLKFLAVQTSVVEGIKCHLR